MPINRPEAVSFLQKFDFKGLFRELLFWNGISDSRSLDCNGQKFAFEAFAQQAGVTAYSCRVPDVSALDYQTRVAIERAAATTFPSHLFVFFDDEWMVWGWSRRELGKPRQLRSVGPFRNSSSFEPILQKLDVLEYDLQSGNIQAADVDQRLKEAFNIEPVTKAFYKQFELEYKAFLAAITGVAEGFEREFASLLLNRLMFLSFIQSKGFFPEINVPGLKKTDYLFGKFKDKSTRVKGKTDYLHGFLAPLFFEMLSVRRDDRTSANIKIFGDLIYLNGGLFSQRDWEKSPKIAVPDSALERIFEFFGKWNWQLDERPTRAGDEINPDVLGYVFEKFINQKQMGAYYTKEDITGYISKNTILPFLFEKSGLDAERPLELLRRNIERYIYPAVKHGCELPLPSDIEAGIADVSKRDGWNKPASLDLGLPTEIWREVVARRARFEALAGPKATVRLSSVSDLITHNLDITQWFSDLVADLSESSELEKLWTTLEEVSILDPTVGSGAFLFAAMGILEPVYSACLERMEGFVSEADARASKQEFRAAGSFDVLRGVLREIDDDKSHPNRAYAIFKKLTVQNLYGVDIMPEATEICKLRLFLKLAAQVSPDPTKPNLGIEPLPDIDFNIRSGNTLVGFATLAEVERAAVEQLALGVTGDEIQDEMRDYGEALDNFRLSQLAGAATTPGAKSALQKQHDTLVEKLNLFNAGLYKKTQQDEFAAWKASHQPFHWCAEFYSVIKNGGFDVIIGNPPYVASSKARAVYTVKGYVTERASDIYAWVLERAKTLSNAKAWTGMIVPLSLSFSGDFDSCRKMLYQSYGGNWFSSFARIPAALFAADVRVRNVIQISRKRGHGQNYTTRLHRWFEQSRPHLMPSLEYSPFEFERWNGLIPKTNTHCLTLEFERLTTSRKKIESAFSAYERRFPLHFKKSAYNWLCFCKTLPPCYDQNGKAIQHTKFGTVYFANQELQNAALLFLNGKIQFDYWAIVGDDFDVTKWMFADFPFDLHSLSPAVLAELQPLAEELEEAMLANTSFKLNAGKRVGNYNLAKCRGVTDKSDFIFAEHLGICQVLPDVESLYHHIVKTNFVSANLGEDAE